MVGESAPRSLAVPAEGVGSPMLRGSALRPLAIHVRGDDGPSIKMSWGVFSPHIKQDNYP